MTQVQPNPFIYDRPVLKADFIGREEIITDCYHSLTGPNCTSIAISGGIGLGKTSLLHHLTHLAQENKWGQPHTNYIFIYLNCSTINQLTLPYFWQRVLEILKQSADNPALRQQIDQTELSTFHFQRLLGRLSQKQFALILQLDDFDWLINIERAPHNTIIDFLSSLRALINHPNYPLTLFIATHQPLLQVCLDFLGAGSPFYNNFISQSLSSFTSDEIDALLKRALDGVNIEFDQADRDFLYRLAGAYPLLLQMASFYLFERRCGASPTNQTYEEVTEAFKQSSHPYFLRFWQESSLFEQAMLSLVILRYLTEQYQLDTTIRPIDDIFEKYELVLTLLTERGLVQKTENSYRIFSDVFAWWIVRKVATESETTLADRYGTISEESLRQAWLALKKLAPQLTLDNLTQTLKVDSSKIEAMSQDSL